MGTKLIRDDTSIVSYTWEPDKPYIPPPDDPPITGGGFDGGLYDGGYRKYAPLSITELGNPITQWGSSPAHFPPPKTPSAGSDPGWDNIDANGNINIAPTDPEDENNIPGDPSYKGDYSSGAWDVQREREDGTTDHFITIVNSTDNSDGSRTVTMITIYASTDKDGTTTSTGKTQTAVISKEKLAEIRRKM